MRDPLSLLAARIGQTTRKAKRRVGYLIGPGHGDARRGIAIAAALAPRHADAHKAILFHYTGDEAMVEWDTLAAAKAKGICDSFIPYAGDVLDHSLLLALAPQFGTLYDLVPYAPRIVGVPTFGPFHRLSDHYPDDNHLLKRICQSVWDIACLALGVAVRPEDAPLPFLAAFPTPDELGHLQLPQWRLEALLHNAGSVECPPVGAARYAVFHNAAGRRATSKVAPEQVMKAIRCLLAADGVACVQVGSAQAPLLEGAIDRRGLRVALTAQLLKGAVACVSNEGYLPYLSASTGTPTFVLFGPTPVHTFLCPGHIPVVREKPACPVPFGSCYSGIHMAQVYVPEADWAADCPLGEQTNPGRPACINFPEPADAAEMVRAGVRAIPWR